MFIVSWYRKTVDSLVSPLQWAILLLIRFSIGYLFFQSGWAKLHTLDGVTTYFTDLGLPFPMVMAPLVAVTEFLCGLFIIGGLLTRLASFPMIFTMIVAILTAKRDEIETLSDLFALSEYLLAVGLLVLVFFGAGNISVDSVLKKKWGRGLS
ncbi:MAG: DoxX family protein [Bdellovibrionales bacterium]|nr:DoxX family protein [Bdellovibrionales bacterium]